jgi:PD-(D/E)XK nuclease superfamily
MKDFATEEKPLRASQLHKLVGCPLSAVLQLIDDDDSSGPAADTGSAMHRAADAWHTRARGDTRAAVEIMRAGLSEYPQADLDRAAEMFLNYASDPRNINADIIQSEAKVRFTLPPCETGQTQEAIWVKGTLDQVRRHEGVLTLCDIKTGGFHSGIDMLAVHAMQLAAYQLGASELLGEPVRQAKIIRVQDYDALKSGPRKGQQRGPVFWTAPWRFDQCLMILDGVRRMVAMIRAGRVWANPGDACKFCPQMGIANCLPRLKEVNCGS